MSEREEADDVSAVEKMSTADRLKAARKKRLAQLKKYHQYERQLEKENNRKSAAASSGGRKKATTTKPARRQRTAPRVQFVSNVVLLEAAARNDVVEVRNLLQRGTSPDACNDDGLTALHQCCIDDSEEMARLLVEYGANVDALDSELWTPLHAASTCAHVHLCRFLVEHNANLLAVNADGNMPYDICEDEVTLDYIESEMAKRGVTQEMIDNLRLSRENLMLHDLQEAARNGADLEYRARQGETPLHIAAANGYIQVTEFLLTHGVSVDVVDSDSWQPIHCATCWGQLPVLEMLLEHGASLHAKTRNGDTAFDLCEDEELRERIAEIQQEIEHSRLAKSRELSRRRSTNVIRSASVRRTSMREKKAMSMKEAREEAQKLLESANVSVSADDDEDEAKSNAMNGPPSTSAVTVKVTPPDVDGSNDVATKQPLRPLRSALRSTDPKVTRNDVPSKSEQNQSASPATDRSGRKDASAPPDLSGEEAGQDGGAAVAGETRGGGGGTTLLDLKRQRAQSRGGSPDTVAALHQPVKSTPGSVGNGDVAAAADHEPRLRLTSPEYVAVVEEKRERRCCVII